MSRSRACYRTTFSYPVLASAARGEVLLYAGVAHTMLFVIPAYDLQPLLAAGVTNGLFCGERGGGATVTAKATACEGSRQMFISPITRTRSTLIVRQHARGDTRVCHDHPLEQRPPRLILLMYTKHRPLTPGSSLVVATRQKKCGYLIKTLTATTTSTSERNERENRRDTSSRTQPRTFRSTMFAPVDTAANMLG